LQIRKNRNHLKTRKHYETTRRNMQENMQEEMQEETKTCSECDEQKDTTLFSRDSHSPDGFKYRCKECSNKRTKRYKEEHPDRTLNYGARYRKAHRDKTNEKQRKDPSVIENNKLEHRKKYYEKVKQFIEDRGGKCLSPLEDYEKASSKLKVECQDGHVFEANSNNLLKNRWCPKCRINHGELLCVKIFEHLFGKIFKKIRPDFLKIEETGCNLELDGYNDELKIAIEYQGIQHYEMAYPHKTDEDLRKRKKYDLIKRERCRSNNILLFAISYQVKHDDLYDHIANLCEENGFEIDRDKEFCLKDCYKTIPKINEALEIIKGKNGIMVTIPKAFDAESRFDVQCKDGHIWNTCLKNLKKGWCSKCASIKLNNDPNRKAKISNTLKKINSTEEGKLKKEESHAQRSETMKVRRIKIREEIKEKQCKHCKKIKEVSEFYVKSAAQDGLQTNCKNCVGVLKHQYL